MSKGMLGKLPLSVVQGPMNDLQNRLASGEGHLWLEGLKRYLRTRPKGKGDLFWYEEKGRICFSVVSNGYNAEQWINHFEQKGIKILDDAKTLLRGQDFGALPVGVNLDTVLIVSRRARSHESICKEKWRCGFLSPTVEEVCCMVNCLTTSELKTMQLEAVTFLHEEVFVEHHADSVFSSGKRHLHLSRRGKGFFLEAVGAPLYCDENNKWESHTGFACKLS